MLKENKKPDVKLTSGTTRSPAIHVLRLWRKANGCASLLGKF